MMEKDVLKVNGEAWMRLVVFGCKEAVDNAKTSMASRRHVTPRSALDSTA